MDWLSTIGSTLKGVFGLVDDMHTSTEEKEQMKIKLQELFNQHERDVMANYNKEMASVKDVIVAELNQDDKYTKRARPTVLYLFIVIVSLNYCLFPFINHFLHAKNLPIISLPAEAWQMFQWIFGVYGVGRSVEKMSGADPVKKIFSKFPVFGKK